MSSPLTPESLAFDLALAAEVQVAPGGDRVVYTLMTVDAEHHRRHRRLWVCGIDGAGARPVSDEATDASGPRWSPDGKHIAFTVMADGGTSLAVADPDRPGELHEVARHAQDVAELAWSPDGASLAYTTLFDPDNPDEQPELLGGALRVRATRRLDYKEDGRGYLGDRRAHVFVVPVAPPAKAPRRLTSEPNDHDSPQWSPDGRSLGAVMHLPDRDGTQLIVMDVGTGQIEELGGNQGRLVHWAWTPDGRRALVASDPDHSLQPDFYLCSRDGGSTERLTSDLRSFPDGAPPVWLDDRHALFHAFDAGASTLETIDIDTGETRQLERFLSRNAGLSVDAARQFVVQAEASLSSVGEIRVFDLCRREARTITRHNGALLEKRPPADWEALSVVRGEFTIDAWLLKPQDFDPDKRYPLILDVHGGPEAHYGHGFLAHEQCFATNGFLVLYANARGSTSYGRRFAQEVIRDWGRGDWEDATAVLDTVLARPYVDADRTGIFGISYGGYITAWAISQSNRFAAAVCGAPIFDLESDYGTSDVAFNGLERFGGGPPHEEREWYESHSPSTYAHQIRTPTLIFHGEADDRCPIGQSEQMFVALRKAGCEVEFVRYPGGSHMFFERGLPDHRADFLGRTLRWFKDHLGDPQ